MPSAAPPPDSPAPDSSPPHSSRVGAGGRLSAWWGAPGSSRRVLARNALWNWGTYVLNLLVLLVLSPFVVRHLGDHAFGVWVLINALTGYMNFADFGIRPAIVHYVARHDAVGNPEAVNRYANSAFVTLACGSALILAALAILAPFLGSWFSVPAAAKDEAAWALLISGVGLALVLPLNAYTAVLIGKQRFDLSCRVDGICTVVRTAGIVAVLLTGGGLVALALVVAGTELIEMAWKTKLAFREQPSLRFAPGTVDRTCVRGLMAFGGFNLVVAAALHLTYQTDALVIGAFMGVSWVTYFDRAAKIPTHTRAMLWNAGRVVMPELGARDARGDRTAFLGLLTVSARNVLLVAAPILVYLLVLGPAFLETWNFGDVRFRERGRDALLVLALGAALPITSYPLVMAHQGTNRMGSLAGFSLLEGALNLGLSVALVGRFGLLGVALGTAIPAALVHGLLLPWWNCRHYGLSLATYLVRVWAVPGGAALVVYGVMRLLLDPDAQYGWTALAGAAAGCVVAFAFVVWLLLRAQRARPTPATGAA